MPEIEDSSDESAESYIFASAVRGIGRQTALISRTTVSSNCANFLITGSITKIFLFFLRS